MLLVVAVLGYEFVGVVVRGDNEIKMRCLEFKLVIIEQYFVDFFARISFGIHIFYLEIYVFSTFMKSFAHAVKNTVRPFISVVI